MKGVLLLLFTVWLRCYFVETQSYGSAWSSPALPFSQYWGQQGGAPPQAQWPSPWAMQWAGQGAPNHSQPPPTQRHQPASPWGPFASQWAQATGTGVPASNPWEQWAKAWPSLMGAGSTASQPHSPPSEDQPSRDPNIVHGWPYSLSSRADPTPSEAAINAYNDMYKEMYKMLTGQVGADPMKGVHSNSRSLKAEHKLSAPPSAKKQPLLRRSLDGGGDASDAGSAASAGSGDKSD